MKEWQNWLDGLVGAFVSSAAGSITVGLVDPDHFNFTTGLPRLGAVIFSSGLVGAALFLRTSPTPWAKSNTGKPNA